MRAVITGASGNLGRRTAELLLDQIQPSDVVLVTRRPESLSNLAELGAVVRFGDFDQPDSLAEAFVGSDRLLLVSTDIVGQRIAQHQNAVDAAKAAGIDHIAYTSITNPILDNPAGVVPEHHATEEMIMASGLHWTFLRNALYSEYRIPEAQTALATGTFRHNLGEGRTAYVSREDCAAAAAAVLASGAEHEDVIYDITGPDLLGGAELAELYGRAGGRPVEAVAVSDDELIKSIVGAGLPAGAARLIASFGQAIRGGYLDGVSTAVSDLVGRPAVPVETVLAGALVAAD